MKSIWLALAALLTATTLASAEAQTRATAVFAGGCFWCVEAAFDKVDGVLSTTSGYTGGSKVNPTYEEVSGGGTGHYESLKVEYDPARVSYERLLDVFWHNVDPVDASGQFCDKGSQYRAAIFVADESQRAQANASKAALDKSHKLPGPIVTAILPAATFYPAETYHQDYYLKNPAHYSFYRWSCGRDKRLEQLWGAALSH
jgi:peptide-methionine (S)-S-oxide reductase